jgi:outer membrane protease
MKSIYAFAFFVSMLCIGVFPALSYGEAGGPASGPDPMDLTLFKTPYRISLAAETGVLLGQAEEIVYKYPGKDAYLSQLLWDVKPMVYLGPRLSLSRANPLAGLGGTADLTVKFGLPILSGTMVDRDWIGSTKMTKFSSHDAYIQEAMLVDFSGGLSVPIKSAVAIKALVSFSYMHFSWIARNGYRKYASEGWEKIPLQGAGITYDQNWILVAPGVGFFWPLHRVLSLDVSFFISSPIYAGDVDTHLARQLQFKDTMRGGLSLEPIVNVSFTPNRYVSLVAHGSWRYISGARGDVTETDIGNATPPTFHKDVAGAGYNAFDVGLSAQFTLPLGLLAKKK